MLVDIAQTAYKEQMKILSFCWSSSKVLDNYRNTNVPVASFEWDRTHLIPSFNRPTYVEGVTVFVDGRITVFNQRLKINWNDLKLFKYVLK